MSRLLLKLQINQVRLSPPTHLTALEEDKSDQTEGTWGMRNARCHGRGAAGRHRGWKSPPGTPAALTQPSANPKERSCPGSLPRGQWE